MRNKHLTFRVAIAVLACLSATSVAADDHKGHDHDDKKGAAHEHDNKARFGGVVAVVKDVNYELVAHADRLVLHVTDHGQPVDLKGATAKVLLLGVSDKSEAVLAPAGDRLEAKGRFPAGAGTKAVATVTWPGKPAATAKFTLR